MVLQNQDLCLYSVWAYHALYHQEISSTFVKVICITSLNLLLTFNLGAYLGGAKFLCSQWKEGAASKALT